jgi:eukaryotic-like serine/threonine-protein kinase
MRIWRREKAMSAAQTSPTGDWPLTETTPASALTIPGYEIIQELGRGGMGVVYKARQIASHQLVALKLIRDGALAGAHEHARFRIEIEATRRMNHANIVQVYEAAEHEGRPYYSMEFVDGSRLDQHLAGRPQLWTEAARLARTLALAVQYAHEQKVIHRDLKPANILLQKVASPPAAEYPAAGGQDDASSPTSPMADSGDGRLRLGRTGYCPKITDFGLAKRLDHESTALTQDGAVLGTASYMAPEQAAGRVRDVGPAVDVYALGAIFYELLTGRPPFQAGSWQETIEQVIHDEPVSPTRMRSDLPRDLETVCLKCLEKDPARRYESAAALAADLGRFLEGQPVTAVPLGAKERLTRLALRDSYQVGEEIGRGPSSTVYRASAGPTQQSVVIKVFRAGICTREEWEGRLRRSIDLWAVLAHPNLVLVQRAGWLDNAPYLAMEHVPHGSLAAKLDGQPYPVRQALQLVEQLADVVNYLHRQGVVHGNLKPSNVLLAADSIPRLTDLYQAGSLFQGALPAEHGSPAGLGYLAPELVEDRNSEPHPHTDIYGLGLILYELLTGRPPLTGVNAGEMLEEVRWRDPVLPSCFNSEVTPYLENFCMLCLRKNPWRRYHRVYDVLKRLRYFLEDPDQVPPRLREE